MLGNTLNTERYWDNTVTPGEELSVNTDRFLRNFGPIHAECQRYVLIRTKFQKKRSVFTDNSEPGVTVFSL